MTPAINLLKKQKISFELHKYKHDAKHPSYGTEAAEKLDLDPNRVFKTLVVQIDNDELVVAILPVTRTLNLKEAARSFNVKSAVMADARRVQNTTGYVLGGVSPLAQKKPLRTVIDASAFEFDSIFVSGGRRGIEIEIAPADLQQLCSGTSDSIC